MAAGGRNERAERGKEAKEKAKQVRLGRPRGLPVGHLTTSSTTTPHANQPPGLRLPTYTTPHILPTTPHVPLPRHPHPAVSTGTPALGFRNCPARADLRRLPRVCSDAVLAHADAAVARAIRLANTLQSRPRLAEGGVKTGPQACDVSDSSRAEQPGATYSAIKCILQLAWRRPCRGSTAAGDAGCSRRVACLGRRMAMSPSPQPSTQPGRSGRD